MFRAKRLNILSKLTFLVLALSLTMPLKAQFYNGSQLSFGKNRVQYTDFFWTYYRFNNFDVYYYLNGDEIAQHVADYATRYIPEIEKKLSISLESKLQFIVFNTFSDLKQSNLGLINNVNYNVGGITHIIGTKVFVYFDGDKNHLEEQIRAGIVQILLQSIVYGSSVTTQVTNNTLIDLPQWFIEGLVAHYSSEWNTIKDNQLYQYYKNGDLKKINRLYDKNSILIGQSIWYYISQKYGEEKLVNILYMTRQSKNMEFAYRFVLGIRFKDLFKDWQKWVENRYKNELYEQISNENIYKIKFDKNKNYSNFILNPNGDRFVFVENNSGRYKLKVSDINTKKRKTILKGGIYSDEKIDYSYPVVAWHPNGNVLTAITEEKGLLYRCIFNLSTNEQDKNVLPGFQKVLDIDYSPDGQNIIMSAVVKGQSDIFLFNVAANAAQPITQDVYNDFGARYLGNSNKIVFSSNRPHDSIHLSAKYDVSYDGMSNNDLFIYDLDKRTNMLIRMDRTPNYNEISPRAISDKSFYYLSDRNGIYNMYVGDIQRVVASVDTIIHYNYYVKTNPVSNNFYNIEEYSVDGNKVLEVVQLDEKPGVYLKELPQSIGTQSELPKTNLAEEKKSEEKSIKTDETKVINRKRFVNVYKKEEKNDTLIIQNQTITNTNIPFFRDKISQNKIVSAKKSISEGFKLQPRNYNIEFTANELISQLDFSYLNTSYQPFIGSNMPVYQNSPTNAFFAIGATDLLEDYRIIAGVRLNYNLENNDYIFGIANLKKLLNKEIYFHRTGFDIVYSNAYIRHKIHELHLVLKYPFNEVFAIKNTLTFQHNNPISKVLNYNTTQIESHADTWAVEKVELIFDNTKNISLNILEGLRYKVFAEYYQLAITKNTRTNVIVTGFDVRHYTKIHRNFIWANRLAGSTSFGKSKLLYYMGGVDNWFFPRFNTEYQANRDNNYAFQTLATNMRGFTQNIRNGNTFLLYSTELRFPVIKYIANKPLRYDFLNDFQIVAFTDIGSAWEGLNPLSDENTFYTKYILNNPFAITVKVQQNPIVAGYGIGARTTIFGYFVRADWAWGMENMHLKKNHVFYLSLSLDF